MNRMIKISLISVLILIFIGCGASQSDESDKDSSQSSSDSGANANATANVIVEVNVSLPDGGRNNLDDNSFISPSTGANSGENNTNSPIVDTHPNYSIAKSNGLEDVSIQFNGLTVTVTTDIPLTEVSSSTIAIYGDIQGNSTDAKLKLNSNYPDGTTFVVKVYKNNKLVGISEELTLGGESIHFDDIP